jgi:hypothetical protein
MYCKDIPFIKSTIWWRHYYWILIVIGYKFNDSSYNGSFISFYGFINILACDVKEINYILYLYPLFCLSY